MNEVVRIELEVSRACRNVFMFEGTKKLKMQMKVYFRKQELECKGITRETNSTIYMVFLEFSCHHLNVANASLLVGQRSQSKWYKGLIILVPSWIPIDSKPKVRGYLVSLIKEFRSR